MRFSLTLLSAAVVLSTSCTGAAHSAEPTTAAKTAVIETEVPADTIDQAQQCVSTDPEATPISVHRALACPDGTSVWVRGVVSTSADGSMQLCDPAPSNVCLTLDGAAPAFGTGPVGATVNYTGTVSDGVLSAGSEPNLGLIPGPPSP